MMPCIVEQANLNDVSDLIQFSEDFFSNNNFDQNQVATYLKNLIRNQQSVFVARNNSKKIIGVLLAISSGVDWRTGHKVVIEQGVYVINTIERLDICKALYKSLFEWAISLGVNKIMAEAGSMNDSVISEDDYKKFRFKSIGKVMVREVNKYV